MLTDGRRGGLPWEHLLYARTYLSSLAVDRLQRHLLGAEALALAVWCKKSLDVCWRYLKRYVPKSLRSKNDDKQVNPRLFDYILSYDWRRNASPDLLDALGSLAKKAKRTN